MTAHRKPRLRVAPKAVVRFTGKIKDMLRRGRGRSIARTVADLAPVVRGWIGGYGAPCAVSYGYSGSAGRRGPSGRRSGASRRNGHGGPPTAGGLGGTQGLDLTGAHRQQRLRSSACTWLFSSTHSTTARPGGDR